MLRWKNYQINFEVKYRHFWFKLLIINFFKTKKRKLVLSIYEYSEHLLILKQRGKTPASIPKLNI